MGSLELVEGGTQVLSASEQTLSQLAEKANREHVLAEQSGRAMLHHAIRAGDALLAAKDQVPYGEWGAWVEANFSSSTATATMYMRVAYYKDELHPKGLGTVREATALLRASNLEVPRSRGERWSAREEATRLREEGWTQEEIAAFVGAHVATIQAWLDPKIADRRRRATRARYERRQAEKLALREKEREQAIKDAVRKAGAATAEAWNMAERMQDVLAQAQRETEDREARRALSEAGVHYRKMRDEIVRALGVS